jgi:hypothetical protein
MEKILMRLQRGINFRPGLATIVLDEKQLHQIAAGLQLAAEYGPTDNHETWGVWAMTFEAAAVAAENCLDFKAPVENTSNGAIMGRNHDEA